METWLLIPLTFATSFLSGIFGMAGGLILMGALVLFRAPEEAMILHGLIQFFANGQRYLETRAHARHRLAAAFAVGSIVAFFMMGQVSFRLSELTVLIMLGALPFLGRLRHLPWPRMSVVRGAFAGGILVQTTQTLAGVAGPLLDLLYLKTNWDRRALVSTKALTQTLSHLLKVAFFATFFHDTTGPKLGTLAGEALLCVPFSFVGTKLGVRILDRMTDASFRRVCGQILDTVGVIYLSRALWLHFA